MNIKNKTINHTALLSIIEPLIEKDNCLLTIIGESFQYSISIFKKGGVMHKELKNDPIIKKEKPTENGFIYENGIENLKNLLLHNMMFSKVLGITLRVPLSDIPSKNIICKIYCFLINREGEIIQTSAQETYNAHVDGVHFTKPEKNVVYCGKEKDDIIPWYEKE